MGTGSKTHHFVTQSQLRRFSIGGKGKQVFVFDKTAGKSWPSPIKKAGSENRFNTLELPEGVLNFEPLFQDVDSRGGAVLGQIVSARSVAMLAPTARANLADFMAVQLLRTGIYRTSIRAVAEDLCSYLAEAGSKEMAERITLPSENDTRLSAVLSILERDRFRDALLKKHPFLLEPAGSARFWISDHPVVRTSSVPYGDAGLESPGIEIYLPLAPDLMLGLLCPTIEFKLRACRLDHVKLEAGCRAGLLAIHDALLGGRPAPCDDDTIHRYNRLQVAQSSRFVYASRDDFGAAREILAACPELRAVRSHVRAGRLGKGLPPRPGMPRGFWLVLHGQNSHYMLPLAAWRAEADPMEAMTTDFGTLQMAAHDTPLAQAEVYEDGAMRRLIREVNLEILSEPPQVRFRITHSDPTLNQLMAAMAARRGD